MKIVLDSKSIHQTSGMSLDLFRALMGVPDGKYSAFKEFNRNVLNVAIKEINQKSDIYHDMCGDLKK